MSPQLAALLATLRNASLVYAPTESPLPDCLDWPYDVTTTREDSFTGSMEHIGCRDIFYEFLSH